MIISSSIGNKVILGLKAFKTYLADFWNENRMGTSEKWAKLVARILIVVTVFITLNTAILRMATMPFEVYYNDFLFFEFLKRITSTYYIPTILALMAIFFNKKLLAPWADLEQGKVVRNLLVFLCGILVWVHATHDYNLYFDRAYDLDRILLLASLLLVYWKPFFVVLFLFVLFPLVGQLEVLDGFSRSTTFLLSRVIILFVSFYIINLVNKGFRFVDFVFMLGCLVAANYFVSGSGKLMLVEWIFNDQTNNLIAATYTNGWHAHMSTESLSELVHFMGKFNVPSRLFAIAIECGFAFMFLHLKWARFLFCGAIIMHLGIFFYSGIFFWMWMLLMVAMLFLFRKRMFKETLIFNKRYFIVAIVLIVSGRYWVGPHPKVWFDSPLNYTYKFEAEISNGSTKMLPPDFFSPYDVQFTFSNFKYLNDEAPLLEVLWGATGSRKLHGFFQQSDRSPEEIFEFEEKQGRFYADLSNKQFLVKFIKNYVRNWNNRGKDKNLISYIKPPRLLWTFPEWVDGHQKLQILKVNAYEVTGYYSDQSGYREIRNRKLLGIPILD